MPNILQNYFTGLAENLSTTLNTPDAYLSKVALTTITIVLGLLLHTFLRDTIKNYLSNAETRFNVCEVLRNSIIVLTIIVILFIWIRAINGLILIALMIGFFVVFLLRGLTHNIIGYFVIRYKDYFDIGDRIEIDNIIGDVIDINPVSFKLLEVRRWLSSDSNTGRVIQVPNSIIFEQSVEVVGVKNIFIWQETSYTLSFESNWKKAENIMRDAGNAYFKDVISPQLEEIKENLPQKEEKLYPVFSLDTNENGIVVTLRYLVDYREGTKTRTSLQRDILPRFANSADIDYAPVYVKMTKS